LGYRIRNAGEYFGYISLAGHNLVLLLNAILGGSYGGSFGFTDALRPAM